MGYLTEKYTRVIRAPYYMYFKESLEIKKVVRDLRELYVIIYRTLPQKIEVEHKIRESLKLQRKALTIARETLKKDTKMAINITVQEEGVLDIIERIEDAWKKVRKTISKEKNKRIAAELEKLNGQFIALIKKTIQEAEREDKGAYNDVMNIIRAAEKTDKTFMANMKTYFKKMDISRLERWAGKFEALGVRKYINEIKSDEARIKKLIKELDEDLKIIKGKKKQKGGALKAEKDFEYIVKKLRVLLKEMEGHIAKEFLNAYKVLKRDLTLIFVLLNQLDDLKQKIEEWKESKKEPIAPEQQIYKRILEIEASAAKHARVMAQGFRRLFHKEKALERF